MKSFTLAVLALLVTLSFGQTVQSPAFCSAVIGSPANGPSHYIDVTWSAVNGATAYQVQYSINGTSWDSLGTLSIPIISHNTGATGNLPFYYRIRAVESTGVSAWTNATPFPMYSACNNPHLPVLSNAGSSAIDISLVPDNNSPNTKYSVYCITDSLYLQSDGTMGLNEVYQSLSAWATATVSGLAANTNYCFYAKAKNNNGDVRTAQGVSFSFFEPWTSNVLDTTATGATNAWWSPGTSAGGHLQYFATGGCTDGNVAFRGSNNNYWSSFLRSPAVNCNGLNQVTLQFNMTNSWFASHPNDKITFTMWAPTPSHPGGTSINALTVNGITRFSLPFDTARNCEIITVVYDLSTVTDKSAILLFLNPSCAYNDGNLFEVLFTNTSIGAAGLSSACEPTIVLTAMDETVGTELNVFPNPFNGHFTLAMNTVFENCSAQLYDETGRKLRQWELPAKGNFDVDASGLTAGVYFLDVLSQDRKILTKKLIRQ